MDEKIVVGTALLLFDQYSNILLSKRLNTNHCAGFYSCPGGKLDAGETILDCIIRETFEETGLNVNPIPTGFIGQHPNTDIGHVVCHWFTDTIMQTPVDYIEKNSLGEPKVERWDWHNARNVPENTMFGTRMALEHFWKYPRLQVIEYSELMPGTRKEREAIQNGQ